jgi:hypothetical protein
LKHAYVARFIFQVPTIAISHQSTACLTQACGLNLYPDFSMHVSDVILECAGECARLSRQCSDKQIGFALFEISARLFSAATHDAELVMDDAPAASQSALHVAFSAGA